MRGRASVLWLLVCLLALTACGGALDPAGEGARRIGNVWWLMFWLGLIPLLIVLFVIVAIARRRSPESRITDRHMVVYGGVVLSSLLLVPVIVMTAVTQMNIGISGEDRLEIHMTGHQFWWEIEYVTPDGDMVRSANELHIPVGTPIDVQLSAVDVIHSVWIPEIDGKMDLIPGQTNELEIRADKPGVYEGRCAEFCGLGHAMMQLLVVAQTQDEFDAWLDNEASPAQVDVDTGTLEEFANSCAPCHTVRGLFEDQAYEGKFGPDLTHLDSRRMIGANILPNTQEALARWIIDPEGVKPGNRMPDVGLDAGALNDILGLLEQLD